MTSAPFSLHRFNGMWSTAILLAALVLAGCDKSPSPEEVSKASAIRLQALLDRDYAPQHANVQTVEVVKLTAPKFEGSATIAVNATTITLPVAVTSDGKTTIVSIDEDKLRIAFQSSMGRMLTALDGKYSNYVLAPTIFALFPKSLQAAREDFSDRLDVVGAIKFDDDYYLGEGCKSHECGSNEAVWTINKHTGAAAAIIMKEMVPIDPSLSTHISFFLYGATLDTLSPDLAEWASEHGMNRGNVVVEGPEYQAPPK